MWLSNGSGGCIRSSYSMVICDGGGWLFIVASMVSEGELELGSDGVGNNLKVE